MPPRPGEDIESYRWRLTFATVMDKLARQGKLTGGWDGLFEEDIPVVTAETIRVYTQLFDEEPPPRLYRMTDKAMVEGVAFPASHLLARIRPNPPRRRVGVNPDTPPGWLKQFVKTHAKVLARKTGAKDNVLGCGHYGCVLESEDPRWVVKITRDPTEGPMVQRIMALRAAAGGTGRGPSSRYDGIVFYRDIYQADKTSFRGKTWPVYVIVREAVRPFTAGMLQRAWRPSSQYGAVPGFPNLPGYIVWRSLDGLSDAKNAAGDYFRWKNRYRRNVALDTYTSALGDVSDAFPEMADTLYTLLDKDIVLRDVHAYNLGFSVIDWKDDDIRQPGVVVIHDLGHTPTAAKEPFDSLWNPAAQGSKATG